ncbi:MAG: recombinase RecT [Nitrospinota bacterium]|nr:recombinase RecT [Nitrospinota bacterium]
MTTTAVAKTSQADTIRAMLEQNRDKLMAVAPRHLDVNRLFRLMNVAVQKTPALLKCTPRSLLASLMQAAQLGLEPDGTLGQAYLIPYWNSKTKTNEAQLQLGYRGLMTLARRSGEIQTISANVVYSNDRFDFQLGLNEILDHSPRLGDRGEMIAVYAVARLRDGSHALEVLYPKDIERAKKSSKALKDGPWVTHPEEMWKKTAIKRLCKYLPLAVEAQDAIAHEDLVDVDMSSIGSEYPEVEEATHTKTEALKEKLAEAKGAADNPAFEDHRSALQDAQTQEELSMAWEELGKGGWNGFTDEEIKELTELLKKRKKELNSI